MDRSCRNHALLVLFTDNPSSSNRLDQHCRIEVCLQPFLTKGRYEPPTTATTNNPLHVDGGCLFLPIAFSPPQGLKPTDSKDKGLETLVFSFGSMEQLNGNNSSLCCQPPNTGLVSPYRTLDFVRGNSASRFCLAGSKPTDDCLDLSRCFRSEFDAKRPTGRPLDDQTCRLC